MAAKEVERTSVTMDDGRTVEFPGKRKMLKDSVITADGKLQVRLDFLNGETRLFTLPESLLSQFALHGAEQKLGDETAGLDDVEDMVEAIDSLTDRLSAGSWTAKRESSGLAGASILARALIELQGKTPVEVRAFLSDKTVAQKTALRNNPRVLPIVQRLEAEKAAKALAKGKVPADKPQVDSDALLDGLA